MEGDSKRFSGSTYFLQGMIETVFTCSPHRAPPKTPWPCRCTHSFPPRPTMDLLAGKPSATVRRLAVVAFLAAVALQLRRPSNAPPALLKSLDARLSQLALPPWKLFLLFLGSSIAAENIFLLLFLNPPELNRGVYKPSFFRAQKILEALDSGFWVS